VTGVAAAPDPAPGDGARPVLELRAVRAGYGSIEVLHGVDLVVPAGGIVALLGPNGVGKTTALKVACGLVTPTAGCVHVAGRHVNGVGAHRLARAGVRTVPEGRGVFPNLNVAENLVLASADRRQAATVHERAYARFPRLGERSRQLAGSLSGGEQQMLALARALATDPALLLVDELSMGLAPVLVEELYGQVARIASEGVSILVVEQFAHTVLGVAHHAALMMNGRIQFSGPSADIAGDLDSAYLGTTGTGARP